jgi:ATP-binding cassette subfamily F protein 2
LKSVYNVDSERIRLEALAEELAAAGTEEAHDQLMDVYERLDDMDADKAEVSF